MTKLANYITEICCKKNIIEEENKEIYCYGFNLILSDIINFSIILILGMIFRQGVNSIIFLFAFCILRRYTGGYHAKTFLRCRITFVITYLCMLLFVYLFPNLSIKVQVIVAIINNIFIIYYSPIEHCNKPLSAIQKKNNKRKAIITSMTLSIILIVLSILDIKFDVTITITISIVVFLMLISILMTKGGKTNV